uniref:Histocompatibility minor 13 n=1 Tax=Pelodiscus sinensis TaxID=13735 RepID=K7FHC5_PELSI|nr:minor histocompatibility antigen H13 [Pelodiscus sinensis]|eukprot:XP_025035393.1 minor histocompatibility antigen H13 [Pelodiscus sinensis]
MPETITSRDAARFPIVASCTLFGLYLFFKIFSQEYINLLLSMYFFVLGILALSHTISPVMNKFFPANFPSKQYQLLFTQGSGETKEEIVNYEFDSKDLVCLAMSSVVGVWYLLRKHWIANNLFGLAFSLNGVELLHLNNVSTGCILLGGLFIYDVFWVFGTNVMVTVAKSFEAPIKLVFPQDLLEKGLEADNFAMLGLGDVVIPGIFIALLLRFDISLKKNTHTYFYTSFVAYIFGLGLTIFIMHVFKHAQLRGEFCAQGGVWRRHRRSDGTGEKGEVTLHVGARMGVSGPGRAGIHTPPARDEDEKTSCVSASCACVCVRVCACVRRNRRGGSVQAAAFCPKSSCPPGAPRGTSAATLPWFISFLLVS